MSTKEAIQALESGNEDLILVRVSGAIRITFLLPQGRLSLEQAKELLSKVASELSGFVEM